MSLSLNEVESLAKKAARGTGYPWGLAEEAAKASRWLAARGVDGCSALATLLNMADGQDLAAWRPVPGDVWAPPGGHLCPVTAGASLADGLVDLREKAVTMAGVVSPVLLLPFAAQVAASHGALVEVRWHGGSAVTDGDTLSLEGSVPEVAEQVTLAVGGEITLPRAPCSRLTPPDETKACLERFAHRTYAPATEDSRLKGAGAGLTDHD